jgi:hypothetical protein
MSNTESDVIKVPRALFEHTFRTPSDGEPRIFPGAF